MDLYLWIFSEAAVLHMFLQIAIPINLAELTGKYLRRSLFLIKLQISCLQLHLKKYFDKSILLWALQNSQELQNTLGGCFCMFTENKKVT